MSHGNLVNADQHILVLWIKHSLSAIKALHEAVNPRAHTRRRQLFEQARRIRCSKNQSLSYIHQKIMTGLAIAVRGQLTQEIGLIQPHHTGQSAGDLAHRVTHWHGHGKPGRFKRVVYLHLAYDGLAVLKHPGQVLRRQDWRGQSIR